MSKADLIIYTNHLRLRMKLRKIPHELPKRIYLNSTDRYWDAMTGHCIALMVCDVHGKSREVALSYDEKDRVV